MRFEAHSFSVGTWSYKYIFISLTDAIFNSQEIKEKGKKSLEVRKARSRAACSHFFLR